MRNRNRVLLSLVALIVAVAASWIVSAGPVQQLSLGRADRSAQSMAAEDGQVTSLASQTVTNERPVASIDTAFSTVIEGQLVRFTDASSDSDGRIVSWLWAFGDGSQAYEANPTHIFTAPGTYEVRLYAVDDEGGISEAARELLVVESLAPVASFRIEGGDQLTLALVNESTTPGSGGEIVHIGWDFGDGVVQAGSPRPDRRVTHSYDAPGTYDVTLYVVDAAGKMGIARMQVTVSENAGADLPTTTENP